MIKKSIRLLGFLLIAVSLTVFYRAHERKSNYNKLYLSMDIALTGICNKVPGTASYIIKDLRYNDISLRRMPNKKIPAASVIKLPILAVVFKALAEDKLSLTEIITINRRDITGGSGILKKMKLPVKIPLQQILNLMCKHTNQVITFR